MPPRYAYWTIILEGKPTAFRARTPEELFPTLKQLQIRHPDTVMRWFARGRLWQSPEEERAVAHATRQNRERRGPAWRPGGEHRDPRDRFKVPRDEARRRFAAKLRRDRGEAKGADRVKGEPGDRGRGQRQGGGTGAGREGRGSGGRGPAGRGPGARGPGTRGPGTREPGARGPGARGPGAGNPRARGGPRGRGRGGSGGGRGSR